jgi:hypothetical protein
MFYVRYLNHRENTHTYNNNGSYISMNVLRYYGPFRDMHDALDFIKIDTADGDQVEVMEFGA